MLSHPLIVKKMSGLRAFVLCVVALSWPLIHQAKADEMQLQNYGYWSYYQFSRDGEPTCSVTQEQWRQIVRSKYVSHNNAGEPVAVARQTGLLSGHILRHNAQITMSAFDGTPLGQLTGSFWILYGASFTLTNAHGDEVAHITLDNHAQVATVRMPHAWNQVLGFATRVQQATRGKDSWVIKIPDSAINVDERVWPLVMAFIGHRWQRFATLHDEG